LGGSDDAGGNHELLPGLGEVDVVSAFLVALVHVRNHLLRNVLGTNMDIGGNHLNQILFFVLSVKE